MSAVPSPGSMSAAAGTTRLTGSGMTLGLWPLGTLLIFGSAAQCTVTPPVDLQSSSLLALFRWTRLLWGLAANVSRETSLPNAMYRLTVVVQGWVRHRTTVPIANVGRPHRSVRWAALRGAVGAPPTSVRSAWPQ